MEWNQLFATLGLDGETIAMLVPTIYLIVESLKKLFPVFFGNGSKWQTRVLSLIVTTAVVVVNYVGVVNLPVPVQLGIISILLWLLPDGLHQVAGKFKKS